MRMLMLVLITGACATPMTDGAPLQDTLWRVAALNGAAASGPEIRFLANGELDANGGCNRIGGRYETSGTSLRADGSLMMTRRACAERERNATEAEFVKVLEAMRSYAISGNTLTLYNGRGEEIAKLEAAT